MPFTIHDSNSSSIGLGLVLILLVCIRVFFRRILASSLLIPSSDGLLGRLSSLRKVLNLSKKKPALTVVSFGPSLSCMIAERRHKSFSQYFQRGHQKQQIRDHPVWSFLVFLTNVNPVERGISGSWDLRHCGISVGIFRKKGSARGSTATVNIEKPTLDLAERAQS